MVDDSNSGNRSSSESGFVDNSLPFVVPIWLNWLQVVLFYLLMAGIAGTVMNTGIGICILRNGRFRSRFYMVVCFLSFTRSVISVQYIVMGTQRLLVLLQLMDAAQHRVVCNLVHLTLFYSVTDVILLIFMLIDGMLAILRPAYYRLLSMRQAVRACMCIQLVSCLVHIAPLFFNVNLTETVTCVNAQSGVPAWFASFCNVEPIVLTGLLLALQLLACALTWSRLRRARQSGGAVENFVFLKRQAEFAKAVRNMVSSHAVLTIFSRLALLLRETTPKLGAYFILIVGIMQAVDIFISPIILLCSKRELREQCLRRVSPSGDQLVHGQ